MRSSLRILAALLLVVAVAGCDSSGRTRPPPSQLRVLNVAPSHSLLYFYREERSMTSNPLTFGAGSSFSFDSDTYDFSLRVVREPWETSLTTLASIRETMNEQNRYYLVATEDGDSEELLFYELPVVEGASTANIVHAAGNIGPVDAYFFAPGTDPAAASAVGTIAFRENAFADDLAAGDYQLVLTAPADAATVLFRSDSFTLPDNGTLLIAIADERNIGTAPFGVYISDSGAQRMVDDSQPSALRVINGVSDMAPRDVYLDGDFSAPFVAAAPFATVGTYQEVAAGTMDITVTPAGNPGVDESTTETPILPGRRYTTIIGGSPADEVRAVTTVEDHRSIDGIARVQVVNTEHAFDNLLYFIVPPGTDTTNLFSATASLVADVGNAFLSLEPRDYELTIRNPVTSAVVAGPIDLTLPDGSVTGILTTDAVGGSTVDVLVFDSRAP